MDDWIKKMWYGHTVEYYSATKTEHSAIYDIMNDLEGIIW